MSNDLLKAKEVQFNNFLNKTIIFSSKKYYKTKVSRDSRELKILDNDTYSEYLNKYMNYNEVYECESMDQFIERCENISLVLGLKSLSDIEKTVIFLLFEEQLTSSEASKILKICSDSVTRIKRRALKKIAKHLKGGISNE